MLWRILDEISFAIYFGKFTYSMQMYSSSNNYLLVAFTHKFLQCEVKKSLANAQR